MAKIKVFLSYSSVDRQIAERIHMALKAGGYDVFFDQDSLPAGESFDVRILDAIKESDLFIFLLSPESIKVGAYTLTELGYAGRKWANPAGRVLPVVIRETDLLALPVYLHPVTLLEPEGNVAADVVAAVQELSKRRWRYAKWVAVALSIAAIAVAIGFYTFRMREYNCRLAETNAKQCANQMRDYAYTAARRELSIYEAMYTSHYRYTNENDIKEFSKYRNLMRKLLSVAQENNSFMSKFTKECNQHFATMFDSCLNANDASIPESDFSFNPKEVISITTVMSSLNMSRSYPYEHRFEDIIKIANQLNELVDRTVGAVGEPSKKVGYDEDPAN